MSISACITSISGPVLLPEERAFLREAKPWGVILMGRSCESKVQVTALVAEIHEALGREALVFIDQEGGRVAVGQYRARRQIVEALPAYKLRSRNGRNAPLPKLPFATTKRVADSLRSYELALKNV